MKESTTTTAETSVDVSCTCHPYRDGEGCRVCEKFDELRCASGEHCAGQVVIGTSKAGIVKYGATPIGEFLGTDSEGVYDVSRSAPVFEFPTLPGVFFCEDCAVDIESGDIEDDPVVLTGWIDDLQWGVQVQEGLFHPWFAAFDRTGGMSWERELPAKSTIGEAVVYVKTEIDRLVVGEVAAEVIVQQQLDVAASGQTG